MGEGGREREKERKRERERERKRERERDPSTHLALNSGSENMTCMTEFR